MIQTCAYTTRTSQFIPTGNLAGSFSRYSRLANFRQNQLDDVYYKDVCCAKAGLCNMYWDVRPQSSRCYSDFPFSLNGL